jgi:hypothetical protein
LGCGGCGARIVLFGGEGEWYAPSLERRYDDDDGGSHGLPALPETSTYASRIGQSGQRMGMLKNALSLIVIAALVAATTASVVGAQPGKEKAAWDLNRVPICHEPSGETTSGETTNGETTVEETTGGETGRTRFTCPSRPSRPT